MRHISDRFSVILDANVLYPFFVRDILLCFAESGFYRALWSADIMREWSEHLIEKRPEKKDDINRTITLMDEAFPEASVAGYADLISSFDLPDKDDRHVLAAAVKGQAAAIVTENQRDFPGHILDQYGIEVRTADEFLLETFQLYPTDALTTLKRRREEYIKPPMTAAEFINALIAKGLTSLAAELKQHEAFL
jgi:predicted nucleic acid-binding protein